MQFFFPYVGNKRKELKQTTDLINLKNVDRIIEPFCGSSSFSVYCYDLEYKGNFILNDLDEKLMLFLKDVKDGKLKEYVDFVNSNLEGLTQEKFKSIISNRCKDLKSWFFYRKVYNFRLGLYPNRVIKPLKLSRFEKLEKFFMDKRVILLNGDYGEVINDLKKTDLIFMDPPYFSSCNDFYSSNRKHSSIEVCANEVLVDDTRIFTDILDIMNNKKASLIGIVNTPYILIYLYKQYIVRFYDKQYGTTKKDKNGNKYKSKTKHMVICNLI